jgi:hypothetical protein
VLSEYVFRGDDAADDVLVRLHGGFLHPLIQMMYGMEWRQPAIVAEALAQACVHSDAMKEFLLRSEIQANAQAKTQMPAIVDLYEAIRRDAKLANATQMKDPNKVHDGVLARAKEEMLSIASQVKVRPDELDERTVEMFNAAVFVAAAAAVHPSKLPRFDFFLM